MSLAIHQLVSTVRVPARRRELARLVERVARESLGPALGAHLGPALDAMPPVVLLEQLNVRLRVSPAGLSEASLIEAWTRAFGAALLEAVEGAECGAGRASERFESEAAWVAEMAVRAARGYAIAHWKLPETAAASSGRAAAVIAILLSRVELLGDVLDELERTGRLDTVLGVLDELRLEELVRAGSRQVAAGDAAISWERIVEVARAAAAAQAGRVRASATGHVEALRVYVHMRRTGAPAAARAILHILSALRAAAMAAEVTADELERLAAAQTAPGVAGVLRQIAARWRQHPERRDEVLAVVRSVVEPAAAAMRAGAGEAPDERRIRVRAAGLFLLADVVRRLEWDRIVAPDGARAVRWLLAGAAASLLDAFDEKFATLDNGVALFAGLGAEPDFAGLRAEPDFARMRHFYASATPADRAALAAQLRLDDAAGDWATLCHAAGARLALELGARVRGFRKARVETVQRQLLCIPGVVRLGRERVVVTLDPCPWNIALHISGRDETIARVAWLGGRSLEIVLEGL